MKKPELLAPAGSYSRAKVAFMYGADAIYAGTTDLSLRTRVGIDNNDFIKIVDLAKKMDKKVYAALNIYAFDEDYEKVKEQAKILNTIGVDGVIVSDGGVVETLKEYAPNVDIHISTQANTVSLETARFWQNLLLSNWNSVFEYIPLESQIHKYQSEYYNKIDICHKSGNSNEFIEFILLMLNEVLDEVLLSSQKESRHISEQVNRLLNVMDDEIPYSANELLSLLNIKSKETLRASYLNPALENGLIKMTLPDKPNSKNQRYIK